MNFHLKMVSEQQYQNTYLPAILFNLSVSVKYMKNSLLRKGSEKNHFLYIPCNR